MKELITKKEEYHDLTNDLTREMDSYLKYECEGFATYIYSHSLDGKNWLIRYPGATRGGIEVDENMIIKSIKLGEQGSIYKPEVKDILEKYIGMKLIIVI